MKKGKSKVSYKRYDISDTGLEEGMIVNGKVKNIKQYGAFIELDSRSKWTFIHRRHVHFKN